MGKSNRLSVWEIRDVMRLVREVCELGHDPVQWRWHALARLCGILGASVGMAYVHQLPMDPTRLGFDLYLQNGAHLELDRHIGAGNLGADPCTPEMTRRLGTNFSIFRKQIVPDRVWYGSEFFNEVRRPCRADDMLCSQVLVPASRRLNGFGFGKWLGERSYGEKEARLLLLFHEELEYLWSPSTRAAEVAALPRLSPRQAETLTLLSGGKSRKEIAAALGLSIHTVHDYVKALHQRFESTSTPEMVKRAQDAAHRYRPSLL